MSYLTEGNFYQGVGGQAHLPPGKNFWLAQNGSGPNGRVNPPAAGIGAPASQSPGGEAR